MNKHKVTLPDGTVATRNSKTRTYTHAVVLAETHAHRVAEQERHIRGNVEYAAKVLRTRGPQVAASYERAADEHRRRLAELEASDDKATRYGVLSWHSTEALAVKAARAWTLSDTTVVPVD